MAEEKKKPAEGSAGKPLVIGWLETAGEKLLPLIVSAVGSIGFVAFAGSVIVWTRFYAVGVPPDQAVAAFPRHELVAIGASLLVLCGFFGALAVLAIYLIDRNGRATPGMSRGLIVLVMFEGAAVIGFAGDRSLPFRAIAAEVVVVALGGVLWATFVGAFVRYEKGLPDRDSVELEEVQENRPFRLASGASAVHGPTILVAIGFALAFGAVAAFAAWLFGGTGPAIWIAGLTALAAALALAVLWRCLAFYRDEEAKEAEKGDEGEELGSDDADERGAGWKWAIEPGALIGGAVALAGIAAIAALLFDGREAAAKAALVTLLAASALGWGCRETWTRWWIDFDRLREDSEWRRQQEEAAVEAREESNEERAQLSQEEIKKGVGRLHRKRRKPQKPPRLTFSPVGQIVVWTLVLVAVVVPAAILREPWLIASLVSAVVLTLGLWRIADLSGTRFVWYGLAIVISVPLFGTLSWMARNLADPQVQPVALIRSTDGPDEAIQGIYVTEADKRVYFASVTTEGCGRDLAPHSGRLLWVPKSEVVAMSIGPLQSVDQAAKTSLEMADTLTPAVETPNGARVSKAAAGQASPSATPTPGPTPHDSRLENVGAAVTPNFGAGLSLEPEDAAPGDVVTLRMSAPNRQGDMHGFGESRAGRTLRLGGVKVNISKEEAGSAANAEYVEVQGGTALKIRNGIVYTRVDGEYVEVDKHPDPAESEGQFVKLDDPSVVGVDDGKLATGTYLRLDGNDRLMKVPRGGRVKPGPVSALIALMARPFDRVVAAIWGDPSPRRKAPGPRPAAIMRDGRKLPLEYALWRQAWHEDHIRFEVPAHAATGPVTVECDQLAGQPYLRVHRPPTARITVRMMAGTGRIQFDSRRSSDKGGKVESRHWTVGGLPAGGKPLMDRRLPPRFAPYRIRLTVSDDEHESGSAELRLLRLPASFFGFGEPAPERPALVAAIRDAIVRAGREVPPAAIEIDGHADDVGPSAYNVGLSLRRARWVRARLRAPLAHASTTASAVPITTRAFGETCPVDPSGGRLRVNRRVEVFILDAGASVAIPHGCHAGREEHASW